MVYKLSRSFKTYLERESIALYLTLSHVTTYLGFISSTTINAVNLHTTRSQHFELFRNLKNRDASTKCA